MHTDIGFPVINSTLSPAQLAVWVADTYGFNGATCQLLKTNMNDSYLILQADARYVLRIYNHRFRDIQQVAEEVRLLCELKGEIGVSYPVAGSDGNYIYGLAAPEGRRYAVLFTYAEGEKVRHLSADMSRSIGIAMARLHKVTQDQPLQRMQYTPAAMIVQAYEALSVYLPPASEAMQYIKQAADKIKDIFGGKELRTGIVHLDIYYANLRVGENNDITFFDFDNCGYGPLVLDLGYYCMQLYHTEPDKAACELNKKAFVAGYRSILSVPDEELALMPYAGLSIWLYYLGLHAERFDYFGNTFLTDNFADMFVNMGRNWMIHEGANL